MIPPQIPTNPSQQELALDMGYTTIWLSFHVNVLFVNFTYCFKKLKLIPYSEISLIFASCRIIGSDIPGARSRSGRVPHDFSFRCEFETVLEVSALEQPWRIKTERHVIETGSLRRTPFPVHCYRTAWPPIYSPHFARYLIHPCA